MKDIIYVILRFKRLLKVRAENPDLENYNVIITHFKRLLYRWTLNVEPSVQINLPKEGRVLGIEIRLR